MNDKPHPNDLRFGAVAFLDALGFKGIWSRYAPRDVIHNLRGVTFGDPMYQDPPLDLERCSLASSVVTLSDTIVVSAAVTAKFASIDVTTDLECQVVALASVCSKAGTICSMILNSNTPLVYRAATSSLEEATPKEVVGLPLGDERDHAAGFDGGIDRGHALVAAHLERDDHLREDHGLAEGDERQLTDRAGRALLRRFGCLLGHRIELLWIGWGGVG